MSLSEFLFKRKQLISFHLTDFIICFKDDNKLTLFAEGSQQAELSGLVTFLQRQYLSQQSVKMCT